MSAKTHKALAKRLKRTGKGKILHRPNGKSHLMSHKSSKRKRALRKWRAVAKGDLKALERQYGRL